MLKKTKAGFRKYFKGNLHLKEKTPNKQAKTAVLADELKQMVETKYLHRMAGISEMRVSRFTSTQWTFITRDLSGLGYNSEGRSLLGHLSSDKGF